MRWYTALFFGLFVTMLQLAFAMGVQGRKTVENAYRNLYQWDSKHYGDIAENGYSSSIPNPPPTDKNSGYFVQATNVAFFPGYPLAIRVAEFVTRLEFRFAALLAAQIAAVGFWAFFVLFLRRLGVAAPVVVLGVIAIVAHPASFYLVTAYSESLFLFAVLAFLYADHAVTARSKVGQVVAGIVMTATRLFGIPVAGYPFLRALFDSSSGVPHKSIIKFRWPVIVGAMTTLGAIFFFLYCAVQFDYWDLYFRRQQWGWGIESDYFAPLKDLWGLLFPSLTRGNPDVNYESRMSASVALWVLIIATLIEIFYTRKTKDRSWRARAPLYLLAWGTWYLLVAALFGIGYQSMIRYSLTVQVFLVPAILHLATVAKPSLPVRAMLGVFFAAAVFFGIIFQIVLLYRFTHSGWVA